jgi:V8-like Glu-specific endopeptidase
MPAAGGAGLQDGAAMIPQRAEVSPTARPTLTASRVGALFLREDGGNHFCTASVVASPDRDLLITAAHCINDGDGRGYRSTQLTFDCDGFTGGTSGSPWIARFDPYTRVGRIVGVLGGYQQGGDTAAVSYSAYFGPAIKQLYQEAISG